MTPCHIEDGNSALDDNGFCVGCGNEFKPVGLSGLDESGQNKEDDGKRFYGAYTNDIKEVEELKAAFQQLQTENENLKKKIENKDKEIEKLKAERNKSWKDGD